MSGFVIAVLLTLALAGSVLWVMPSPREKRLAGMRRVALEQRMHVRLLDQTTATKLFPWVEDYRLLTLYEIANVHPAAKSSTPSAPIVIRLAGTEEMHELDREASKIDLLEGLGILEQFPEGSEAIVHYGQASALLWNEKGTDETVPLIANLLKEVQRRLSENT